MKNLRIKKFLGFFNSLKNSETIAIIIARGGSKGIPRKNLVDIAGKPLIAYTIEKALEVSKFYPMDVLVSTEDKEIKLTAESYGAWCPFYRPKKLAEDNIPSFPVVEHALAQAESIKKKKYKYIAYMQPTSPLWKVNDLVEALNILSNTNDFNSVVAITEVETHPFRMKRLLKDGRVINYIDQGFEDMRPRQSLPKVYRRAGSFYVSKRKVIVDEKTLVDKLCYGFVVSEETAIDIDTKKDLATVRSLLINN